MWKNAQGYNIETIKEALEYYQNQLKPFEKQDENIFYFIYSDLNQELTDTRNFLGVLSSKEPELDTSIPKYKNLICSALHSFKEGIEDQMKDYEGKLKTQLFFDSTKKKIEAIDKMVKKICDGDFNLATDS